MSVLLEKFIKSIENHKENMIIDRLNSYLKRSKSIYLSFVSVARLFKSPSIFVNSQHEATTNSRTTLS